MGNGETINFLTDKWIPEFGQLWSHCLNQENTNIGAKAKDLVATNGEWNWEFLETVLEINIVYLIAGFPSPNPSEPEDKCV